MNLKKFAVFSALTFALVFGLVMLSETKTQAAGPWYVNSTTGMDTNDCLSPATACRTINAAIGKASPGDTINVAAGTYHELVNVNKQLTILGAQANVDARTRAVPVTSESVVDGMGGTTSFYVTANDVTINGFTVQGATIDNQFGAGIVLGAGTSGAHVLNNIIQNNIAGLFLANSCGSSQQNTATVINSNQSSTTSGCNQAVIQYNLFRNNTQPGAAGGHGIYSDEFVAGGAVSNVLIDSNTFTANTWGIGISNTESTNQGPFTNLNIQNNTFDSNSRGMYFFFTNSSTIVGNVITNSPRYGIGFFGGDNGFTIQCNTIQNNPGEGILLSGDFGPNSNISANYNNISGNATAGLEVDTGSYMGGAGSLNAENNWWGSATGPTTASNPGGSGDTIIDPDGVVDYSPWLTSVQGLPCPTPPPTTRKACEKAADQRKKDFDQQQAADKKTFDAQQQADKKTFDSQPHTPQQKKAFDDQQKAQKKTFEDNQKAAKDAFEQQNKADREQCKMLP